MRWAVPVLALIVATAVAACSGDSSGEPTTDVPGDAPSPVGSTVAEPSPTPAPTATVIPLPSPTPEIEPVSDTESVGQYIRAHSLLNQGEYREAERQFHTVIQLEPEFAHGWDGVGEALLFQGEYEEAMYYLDKAIELRPALATAYSHRALARVSLSDPAGAERDAQQALRLNDDLVDPYVVLGRVYAVTGQLNAALENFDKAVELVPDDGGAYWWRGRFWRDYVEDYVLALQDFDKAVELSPAVAAIYLDRATLLLQAGGDFADIRADLEEAISLSQEPRLPNIIARAEELLEVVEQLEAQFGAGGG